MPAPDWRREERDPRRKRIIFVNRDISPPFCPGCPANKKAKNPAGETENYYTKYTDSCKLENIYGVQEKILYETTAQKMKDLRHSLR